MFSYINLFLITSVTLIILSCTLESEPHKQVADDPGNFRNLLAKTPISDSTITETPLSQIQLPSFSNIVEKVNPSVVSISTQSLTRGFFYNSMNSGAGSGIIVKESGFIVTNYHVINNASEVKVHLSNGQSYTAKIIGADYVSDLAVLKINASNLTAAKFANTEKIHVGDWVLTIGNALALKGNPTVTFGIVSGIDRTLTTSSNQQFYNLIQTDAAINSGNSGGPLINLSGEVIGINHAIIRQAEGVGFAISSSEAIPIIDSLIKYGRVIRPLMGMSGFDLSPATANELGLDIVEGVIVTSLTLDGPSHKAGLQIGDVMMSIDNHPTTDVPTWLNILWSYRVGDKITVQYNRQNKIYSTTVTLIERPQ